MILKKFIKSLSVFFAPLLLLAILSEVALRHIPNDYSLKKHYLDKNAKNIQVLILGSSHAYFGLDPQYFQSPCFNAGYVSQSILYDWDILEKYRHDWDSLRCIILPVDYFTFYSTLKASIESWRIRYYQIYYGFYDTLIPEDNFEILNNKLDYSLKKIYRFYITHSDSSYITQSKLGWGTVYNSRNKQDLDSTGIKAAKRHTAIDDRYFNDNVRELRSIMEFTSQRKIKLILLTFPSYSSYYKNLDSTQLNRTLTTVQDMVHSYSNCSYYNLLTDQEFSGADFYDGDHLNELGAKKLSLKINDLIK